MDGIIYLIDMSFNKLWEIVKDREALCAAVHGAMHGITKSRTKLSKVCFNIFFIFSYIYD